MKKLILILIFAIASILSYGQLLKVNVMSDFIILNDDSVKFASTQDNQIVARINGKWTNWTPDFSENYSIDSIWFANDKLYIRQGSFTDSTSLAISDMVSWTDTLTNIATTYDLSLVDQSSTNEIQTLTYTASSRLLDISGSATDATLPLFSTSSTNAGLVNGGSSISAKFLRGDNSWQTVITSEVDGSISNEIQNLSRTISGTYRTISISGGTATGFSIADSDSSTTNELNSSASWTDATNTFAVVDAGGTKSAVITGFLEAEVDGSVTNEIQNLSRTISGNYRTISISGGGTATGFSVADADSSTSNEYNTAMSWTDATNTISLTDGGSTKTAVVTGFLEAEVDGSISNELQNISYTASTRAVAISSGTGFTFPEVIAAGASGLMIGTDKTKLDGIASGAEVNVNADWNATSGDAVVLNKPSTYAPSAHALSSHSDMTITSIASNEVLIWNGTKWINNTLSEAGIQGTLAQGNLTESVTGLEFDNVRQVIGGSLTLNISTGYAIPTTSQIATWNSKVDSETDPIYSADKNSILFAEDIDTMTFLRDESDPLFISSVSNNIDATDTLRWGLKLSTETDPIYEVSLAHDITSSDTTRWGTLQNLSGLVQYSDTINKIATKDDIKDFAIKPTVLFNILTVSTYTISVTYPNIMSFDDYYLDIKAWYNETVDGKVVPTDNGIYDVVKSRTGFTCKLNSNTGFLKYIAMDSIDIMISEGFPAETDPIFLESLAYDIDATDTTRWGAGISNNSVTNAMLADMANATIKGRLTTGSGDPEDLTATQIKSILSLGNVENTALSTWIGTTNITTLGTIISGTWTGNAIGDSYLTKTGNWTGTFDGQEGSYYLDYGNLTNKPSFGTGVTTWLATPTSANLASAITNETGSGVLVFATSPTLVTPTLGVATATSINKVSISTPASSATLTLANGSTLATSGAYSITLTSTATTSVTLPTSGTLATTAIVEDNITNGATTTAPSENAVYDALVLKLDKPTVQTLTYNTTDTTMNYSSGADGVVTLTGNITTLTMSNVVDGGEGQIAVIQNATGGYGISAFAHTSPVSLTVKFIGGVAPTSAALNSVANGHSILSYKRLGSYLYITYGKF